MITKDIKTFLMAGMMCCGLTSLLSGCSNEDYLGGHYVTDGAGVLMNVTAQINSQSDPTWTWTEGDVIGIAAGYGANDVTARNREYICKEDGRTFVNTSSYPIYVKGTTDIVAYYPFIGTDQAEPTITLDTRDQTNVNNFLFAKAEDVNPSNGSQVNLVFKDALAQLNMNLTVPQGEQIHTYRLSGLAQQATADPYTLDLALQSPEDLVGTGENIKDLSLKLIPQATSGTEGIPSRLVLVGKIRSYSIDLSDVSLEAGSIISQTVDVSQGITNLEFVPAGAAWKVGTMTGNAATEPLERTFQQGDIAGLFAVKNGQVIRENVMLTYSTNGFWEAAEPLEAGSEFEGAKFYVYYPYTPGIQFDASSNTPLAAAAAKWIVPAKQNSKVEYDAADMMVSSAATVGELNAVKVTMQHQKAMVTVELPNSSYIFSNPGIEPYVLAKAENAKFTLDGTAVQPYFDETTQTYQLVIEPHQASTLKVTYTNNGEEKSFETSALSQLQAGQYAKIVIDGGAQLVNTTLQVGDYYCADGRIVSKNATSLPSNIIGVIFKLGTTDAIRSANSNWSHAVVLALNEPSKAKWGTNASPTSAQNNAGWRYWYRSYNLADQNGVTDKSKLNESLMAEEGYETTLAWRAVPEPLTIGGETLDYTTGMNTAVNAQIEGYPLPNAITSGWYIPSLVDWRNVEAQLSVVSAQLSAAGGKKIDTNPYWSCNVRGAGSNWCYQMGKTKVADRYYPSGLKDSRLFRFMFAF